jgi:hypothetical protein
MKLLVICFLTIAIYKNVVIKIDYIYCCFMNITNAERFVLMVKSHDREHQT